MTGIIYCFSNIHNNKKYVGQTTQRLDRRIYDHMYVSKSIDTPFYRSIRRYGENGFIVGIIEECVDDDLNEREKYWIKELHSHVREWGYNSTTGGDSQYTHSDETKNKMSLSQKNRPHDVHGIHRGNRVYDTPEYRSKISQTLSNGSHRNISTWEIEFINGDIIVVTNLSQWCRENGYNKDILSRKQKNKTSQRRTTHKDIVRINKMG